MTWNEASDRVEAIIDLLDDPARLDAARKALDKLADDLLAEAVSETSPLNR